MDRKDSLKKKCCGKYALNEHTSVLKATDKQIGGKHYKDFKIQPIEFITKNKLSFIQGNIIKYVCRYDKKNGNQDIDKAIHYCELLKEIK
tara:strand:+ start:1233 stop:1502 length:270 start_codon:yes stop_codon:yes gene_type:complete